MHRLVVALQGPGKKVLIIRHGHRRRAAELARALGVVENILCGDIHAVAQRLRPPHDVKRHDAYGVAVRQLPGEIAGAVRGYENAHIPIPLFFALRFMVT